MRRRGRGPATLLFILSKLIERKKDCELARNNNASPVRVMTEGTLRLIFAGIGIR
jgi:hypothetical protein